VQQPFGVVPALFLVQRPGGAGPAGGGELQVAVEALRDRPADEVASLRAMADVFTGEPGIEVGLLACDECESAAAQPVEQADSRANSSPDYVELAVGGVGAVVALPKPPQHVPDRVAVQ
jgi:hypothetical protein